MVNAKTEQTVKSIGSSPEKRLSVKKITSKNKVKKTSKKTTTKVTSSRKNSNNGFYKAENTLKVRRTNVNELKTVEKVIERLSQGPQPSVQKTIPVIQKIAPTVRRTVPGVLRIVHDVQGTVPSTPKAIPIVEAGNFLKKCVKQYWASA